MHLSASMDKKGEKHGLECVALHWDDLTAVDWLLLFYMLFFAEKRVCYLRSYRCSYSN